MAEERFADLGGWLGITAQQSEILDTIHRLQTNGKETSPKNIIAAYHKDYGRLIQISNLFHVIHALTDKRLLKRGKKASYNLDLPGIQAALDDRENEESSRLDRFKEAKNDLKTYLQKASWREETPEVAYLDGEQFFNRLAGSVSSAKTHYMTGPFPKLFYPEYIQEKLGRYNYLRAIKKRCLTERSLNVRIITDFNIDFFIQDVKRFSSSSKDAKRLASSILDQIHYYIEHYDNLKVYYLEKLVGMDYVLPVQENPSELYIYMRDESGDIVGGVYVNSISSAGRAHATFAQFCRNAAPLRAATGRKLLKQLKKKVMERIGNTG
jgi:hypothetical protein